MHLKAKTKSFVTARLDTIRGDAAPSLIQNHRHSSDGQDLGTDEDFKVALNGDNNGTGSKSPEFTNDNLTAEGLTFGKEQILDISRENFNGVIVG